MTDISFSVPAKLLAASDTVASLGKALDHGSLGRMVGKVMDTEPHDRWRYAILLEGKAARLHLRDIEALAGTRGFADWRAGQV